MMKSVNVLFVCLGNICRSPIAQGIFQQNVEQRGLQQQILIDSAGTASFHIGKSPDPRAILAAQHHGYSIKDQIARQIEASDFARFNYIIAMDRMNLGNIKALAPQHYQGELHLFLEFTGRGGINQVPDPYKEGEEAFEKTVVLLEKASVALLDHIIKNDLKE